MDKNNTKKELDSYFPLKNHSYRANTDPRFQGINDDLWVLSFCTADGQHSIRSSSLFKKEHLDALIQCLNDEKAFIELMNTTGFPQEMWEPKFDVNNLNQIVSEDNRVIFEIISPFHESMKTEFTKIDLLPVLLCAKMNGMSSPQKEENTDLFEPEEENPDLFKENE